MGEWWGSGGGAGMGRKLGGMEECHLGFIKGGHKGKYIYRSIILLWNLSLSSYLCLDIDCLN